MAAPAIDWREEFRRREHCELELHPDAHWHRRVLANGAESLEFYCPTCDRPVTKDRYHTPGYAVTALWLADRHQIDAKELPVFRRSLRINLCYLCGATAQCEFHHVAPQALYKERAALYPLVPLCEACHKAETKDFTDRLEAYVQERIRRFLDKRGAA